jgi:hypothetical protein
MAAVTDPTVVTVEGYMARIRPVLASDFDWLYKFHHTGDVFTHGRLGGKPMDEEAFAERFRAKNFVDYIIERKVTGQRVGYIYAYNADIRNGFLHWGMEIDPLERKLNLYSWYMEAVALFFDEMFGKLPLHMLLMDTYEYQERQFEHTAARWFRLVCTFEKYGLFEGVRWDRMTYGLTPESWLQQRDRADKVAQWVATRMEGK